MPPDDAAAFANAHRELISDRATQFDMTGFKSPELPAWLEWLETFLTSPMAKYLLWAIVALAVLLLFYLLARHFGKFSWWVRKPGEEQADAEAWRPEPATARVLLAEADRLAGDGRFDEAARLLLFRSIEDIDTRRPQLVRPALTSRDIARAPELPAAPRVAFGAIVSMVEKSLFGGRPLGEPDWLDCRAAYHEFAFAGAWR